MSKKTLRIITVIATIILCVSMSTLSFALTPGQITPSQNPTGASQIQNAGQNILGVISVVGMVISVIVLMILGIKYMIGSAEQKAEYKKSFIPYIVGAVLVFSASGIAQLVFNAANNLISNR